MPAPSFAAPLAQERTSGELDRYWPLPVRLLVLVISAAVVGAASALDPRAGVGAVLAVALGLLLVHRPVLAALLAVAVGPAVSGLQRGLLLPGARLSELLLLAAAGVVLVLSRAEEPPWGWLERVLLLWAAASLVLGTAAALRHGTPLDADALGDLVLPLQFLLLVRVAQTALQRREDRARALRWALLAGGAVALAAVGQRLLVPVQDLLVRLTGVDNYGFNTEYFVARVTGPFTIWHYLGAYLMLVALVAVALLMSGGAREVLPLPALLVVLVLALVGVVLTLTLAVLAGLALGYLALALWSPEPRRWLGRGLVAAALAGVAGAPLLLGRVQDQTADVSRRDSVLPETLATRWEIWSEQYLPALAGRWLGGWGPGSPPEVSWEYPESVYLQYLLQGGLGLLLVFLLVQAVVLVRVLAARDRSDPVRAAAATAVAATTLALVPLHAVFPYMTGLGLPQLLWGLTGLALAPALARSAQPGRRRATTPLLQSAAASP